MATGNRKLSKSPKYLDSNGELNLIAGTNVSISSTDSSITISATDTNTTYTNVSEFINDANYLDSITVQGVIDASYIQANQTTYTNVSEFVNDANYLDSTTVQGVIDATYIQANQTTYNTSDFLDSTTVANVVDAAYVQARQITYNTSDFVDSAYVTTQINNLIGSAPGTLDTLEEIANALNNDSNAYGSLVALINGMADSDWVQSLPVSTFTNDANYLDSTTVQGVIDATYIQANQTTYSTADFLDSYYATALIDSAYIAARTSAGTDSATVVSIIGDVVDSNYVQARTASGIGLKFASYVYTADSGDTTFSGVDNNGATLAYVPGKIQVHYNGVLLVSGTDYTASNGTSVVFTNAVDSGDVIDISSYTTTSELDSIGITTLITSTVDSAYIAARVSAGTDSATVVSIISDTVDAAYVQARQTTYNTSDFLDSTTVSLVVDAAYVQARQTTYNTSNFTDSAFVTGLPISTFTNDANYLDSTTAISVIRSTEANAFGNIHVPGQTTISADSANDVLNIVGNNGIRIVTDAGGNEIDISFVNSANYLDSTTVTGVIDATYIQANQTTYSTADFLDSTYAIALIDSAYIEARRPAETIFGVVNNGASAYTFSGDGFPSTVDNPTLYLARGKTYKFSVNASSHPFEIRLSNGGSAYSDGVTNNGAQVGDVIFTVPMNAPNSLVYQCTVHSGMVGDIVIFNENSFLDSSTVTGVIDATYIQANQTTYTNVSEFTNDANYLDSTTVQGVIDASYIQSNQTTYSTADFLDSYYAIELFDSAYIQLRQSSVGSGGLDSALVIDLIDSAYIQARQIVGGAGGVDSAATVTLITDTVDSAYVQTRQTTATTVGTLGVTTYTYEADSGDTIFSGTDVNGATLTFASSGLIQVFRNGVLLSTDDYTASSNTVTLTFGADSADVISISAFGGYQSISGRLGIDVTDSSAVFGQTVFARTYTPGKIMVFRNGVLLKDSDDYTATNGTSIILASAADSNDYISISEFIGDNGIDSATAISLIDSAHVQLRQDYAYSSLTGVPTNVSTFTNDANYLDSTTVQGVINSSYIQSNQITYNTSDFVDSAYVTTQINNLIGSAPGTLDTLEEIANALNNDSNAYGSLVALINGMADSDWVQSLPVSTFTNDANYLDSTTVQGVIDATYIQSNQTTYTNVSEFVNDANYLDSTTVQGVINSSYIQSNQITYNTADFPDSAGVIALISSNETTYTNVSEFVNDANYLDSTTVLGVIDATYVNSLVSSGTDSATVVSLITSTVDSAYVQARQTAGGGGTDSAVVNNLIDAKLYTLDVGDVVGDDGDVGDFLRSTGNGGSEWFSNVSTSFAIKAVYDSFGALDSIQELPAGWSIAAQTSTTVTLNHNTGRMFKSASFLSWTGDSDGSGGYDLRLFMAPNNVVTVGVSDRLNKVKVNVDPIYTGADSGAFTYINLVF